MTLYEITEEQRKLEAMLEESEGEMTPEIEQLLEVNKYNMESKAAIKNSIKADPMLSQYGNEAYKALKGGAR